MNDRPHTAPGRCDGRAAVPAIAAADRRVRPLLVGFGLAAIAGIVACSGTAPQPPNAAAPAKATAEQPTIPGLAPADVYLNLTEQGFTKDGPRHVIDQYTDAWLWSFELDDPPRELLVEIDGPDTRSVWTVQAWAVNTAAVEGETDRLAREFLAYVATAPYSGAETVKARKWVEANVGRNARTVIGGVEFELFANAPRVRGLRLSPASADGTAVADPTVVDVAVEEEAGTVDAALPKSAAPTAADRAERDAAAKFKLATVLHRAGKFDLRDRYLRELVREWPETAAADEARAYARELSIDLREADRAVP